jgi:hypothetical protein
VVVVAVRASKGPVVLLLPTVLQAMLNTMLEATATGRLVRVAEMLLAVVQVEARAAEAVAVVEPTEDLQAMAAQGLHFQSLDHL